MSHTSKRYEQQYRDPAADLQAAIDNLEKFTNNNESEPIPHVTHLDVSERGLVTLDSTPLQKTIDMMRTFFGAVFSDKVLQENKRKRILIQNEVLRSIDVVKSHYLFIEKLKKGSPKDKQLADSAITAVKRYNAIMEQSKQTPDSWSTRIARFLYEQSGLSIDEELKTHAIDLPQPISMHCNVSKKDASAEDSKKILQTFHAQITVPKQNDSGIDVRLLDAYRIKASALLIDKGIIDCKSEALSLVRETPIISMEDPVTKAPMLIQKLNPWPGVHIQVTSTIKSCQQEKKAAAPIPENLELSYQAIQTGFPHPSQRAGWSLADQLIPACPHRLDEMPGFRLISQNKKILASDLLPGGKQVNKARQLLKLKRQAFHNNRKEFIQLHKELSKAIIAAAPVTIIPENAPAILDCFYEHLEKQQAILDYLSSTNQIILDHFIARPYEKLQTEWLERSNAHLISKDPLSSYEAALKILEEQIAKAHKELNCQKEQSPALPTLAALDYIKCMGGILGSAAQFLILQYISENIEFAPPMLNTFEQKLQTSVYKHLQDFLAEFEIETDLARAAENIRKQLKEDLEIFTSASVDELEEKFTAAHIVNELEGYFNARYLSRRV